MMKPIAIAVFAGMTAVALGSCANGSQTPAASEEAASTSPPSESTTTTTAAPPQRLLVGGAGETRTAEVTLHGVEYPVEASGAAARIAPEGKEFAVADLTVCPKTSNEPSPSDFYLIADNSMSYTFWNVQIGARDPNLTQSLFNATPGLCMRGYLTYPVDPGSTLTNFVFVNRVDDQIVWSLK